MRSYQQKLATDLARICRSNDPLRWAYAASRLGVNRPMTPREVRILSKRAITTFKDVGKKLAIAFEGMVATVKTAADGIKAMAEAIKESN